MSTELKALLDAMQARCDAATDGPWSATHGPHELPRIWSGEPQYQYKDAELIAKCSMQDGAPDAEFIAASRQDLPRLVAAVEAVLKLHGPLPVYLDASDCGCVDEDHAIIDSIDGDPLCSGSPTGDHYCDECTPEECGAELVEYPCPTVAAIRAALIGDGDE